MENDVLIAVLSLCGTAIGSIGGILASNKLFNYRLDKLEEKVDKHNNLVERMYEAEGRIDVLDEKQDVANHRISDCETAIEKNRDKLINFTRR